jgi:hypothetical protein
MSEKQWAIHMGTNLAFCLDNGWRRRRRTNKDTRLEHILSLVAGLIATSLLYP